MCQSQAWGVGEGPHGARPGSCKGGKGFSGIRVAVGPRMGLGK